MADGPAHDNTRDAKSKAQAGPAVAARAKGAARNEATYVSRGAGPAEAGAAASTTPAGLYGAQESAYDPAGRKNRFVDPTSLARARFGGGPKLGAAPAGGAGATAGTATGAGTTTGAGAGAGASMGAGAAAGLGASAAPGAAVFSEAGGAGLWARQRGVPPTPTLSASAPQGGIYGPFDWRAPATDASSLAYDTGNVSADAARAVSTAAEPLRAGPSADTGAPGAASLGAEAAGVGPAAGALTGGALSRAISGGAAALSPAAQAPGAGRAITTAWQGLWA